MLTYSTVPPLSPTEAQVHYSPYPKQNFPDQVFFGDTHLHTAYSTDAGMVGCTLGPEDAYRFARGETVTSSTGLPARLRRPLDFLVVSDHSENLGLAPAIAESDPELLKNEWGKMEHDLVKSGTEGALKAYENWMEQNAKREDPLAEMTELKKTMWERETEAAEKYNQPGLFTAFIGFEWTSMPDGNNLHRNVIFRDGKDKADQIVPFSQYDSFDPEDLWKWMEDYEKKTGGKLLAIPHNKGVPMGGDLKEAPEGKVPTLLIRALRDPAGANLDRVQIIKGWTDASGETHEKVYDVAWSDDRKPGSDGKLPPVGNTVNIQEATYDNSIGAPFLQAYWKDADFDPS